MSGFQKSTGDQWSERLPGEAGRACCAGGVTFPRFFVFQEASFMLPVFPVAER